MLIAADDIIIKLGGEEVILHPSLRNAIRLERRPGGFQKLLADIAEDSLSAAIDIVLPYHHHPFIATHLSDAGLTGFRRPFSEYVAACAGLDPDDPTSKNTAQPRGKAKTVPIGEFLAGLYRAGTGWLGWDPETTLEATPAEITEAMKGRVEMLQAIFGGGTDKPTDPRPWDQKARDLFAGRTIKEG